MRHFKAHAHSDFPQINTTARKNLQIIELHKKVEETSPQRRNSLFILLLSITLKTITSL